MTMFYNLRHDARFYHQILFPGMQPTCISWIIVLFGSRGLLVLVVHRISYFYFLRRPTGPAKWFFIMVVHLGSYISKVFTKCHIVSSTQFEPGVYLSNRGHIILGARKIGTGTIIHDRVTIGMNLLNKGIPEIGRNVWIGPHSIINGEIYLGDGVTILPGTVLTKSLPARVVVQGNPARIVKRDFDNSELRRTLVTDVITSANK